MYVIYKIENTRNNKILIGQTIQNPSCRWSQYKSRLRRGNYINSHLQNAWIKYGEKVWEFSVLDSSANNQQELDILEESYMQKYNSRDYNYGYNIRGGGHGGGSVSDETKAKIRNIWTQRGGWTFTGKTHSKKTKLLMKNSSKGKKFSKEHCENISKAKQGTVPWNLGKKYHHKKSGELQ